ncbi:MAG: FAD-binding oxidoreductase, partial [Candidatus Micrarchaeaceae archaeon]
MPEPLQAQMSPFEISDITQETPEVNGFKFKSVDNKMKIKFDPGMFVMLTYVNNETKEKIARAFSLASAPSENFLEFYISMIHGRFTSHLDTAKVGDIYYVSGPHGQFKFVPSEDKKVLYLAGGTGIAPFISMLREIKLLSSDNDVSIIYSIRYPNEIIRKEELEQLEKELKLKTTVTVTRSKDGDGWNGEKGHINAD